MSKKILYLLGILVTIGIGTFFFNMLCCSDCCQKPTNDDPNLVQSGTKNSGESRKFNLSSPDLDYKCDKNFKFLSNGFKNIQPVGDSIDDGIGKLKSYFEKNNDKLIITGYALKSEKNTSAFPNLALARANDIKDYFVSKGIPANRFELKGDLTENWKMSGDTLIGNADFKITQAIKNETEKTEDWESLKAQINLNPLTLYFKSGQAEISLNDQERQKVADLVKYLDNVPNSTVQIAGHTDNAGNRDLNIKLGLERANFAKEYLVKNGIKPEKILTNSIGPDEPIADNKTQTGKAKNRRTVITLN